ncbi:MAG TPA: hypothetical protein VIG32_03720 [Candidatus Baltobacteraceae bacterium]|jgi:hypothetical protein
MRLRLVMLAVAVGLLGATASAAPPPGLPPQPAVRPAWAPPGTMLVSPCVATMGSHWANPRNLPFGPIYGEYAGKPVFTEIMIDKKAFAKGGSWDQQLKPLPGYSIDHVDVDYVPYGHAGYPIPHYDVHAYYVPHATHEKFCPNGIKLRTAK